MVHKFLPLFRCSWTAMHFSISHEWTTMKFEEKPVFYSHMSAAIFWFCRYSSAERILLLFIYYHYCDDCESILVFMAAQIWQFVHSKHGQMSENIPSWIMIICWFLLCRIFYFLFSSPEQPIDIIFSSS